jgi:hypothetical protein
VLVHSPTGLTWAYKMVQIDGSDLGYLPFDCTGHYVTVTSLGRSLRLVYQKYNFRYAKIWD